MAAEMRDLPGHSDGETGFHHTVAYGEAAGMSGQNPGPREYTSCTKFRAMFKARK